MSRDHVFQTILHFVQFGIGYLLMLIAMTFNLWMFLAVIVGEICGLYYNVITIVNNYASVVIGYDSRIGEANYTSTVIISK